MAVKVAKARDGGKGAPVAKAAPVVTAVRVDRNARLRNKGRPGGEPNGTFGSPPFPLEFWLGGDCGNS